MKKTIRVFLTGGLGNQLFQLAAALHFGNDKQIELDLVNAHPRINSSGVAELLSLNLPTNLNYKRLKKGKITQKIFGYNLRTGYFPKKFEKTHTFQIFRNIFSSLILSLTLGKIFKVRVARDLGHDPLFEVSDKNEILIGYFQTYRIAEDLLKLRDSIFLNLNQSKIEKYDELCQGEWPLLVHVRLSDYKEEDHFGIVSIAYYFSAIEELWGTGKFKKIWLFSDEPTKALDRIPTNLLQFTRVIENAEMDSADTLKIMTLCKGFILANSTFSWWAAYLREDQSAPVIAPYPWFKLLRSPTDLIPETWKRLPAFE